LQRGWQGRLPCPLLFDRQLQGMTPEWARDLAGSSGRGAGGVIRPDRASPAQRSRSASWVDSKPGRTTAVRCSCAADLRVANCSLMVRGCDFPASCAAADPSRKARRRFGVQHPINSAARLLDKVTPTGRLSPVPDHRGQTAFRGVQVSFIFRSLLSSKGRAFRGASLSGSVPAWLLVVW